MSYCLSLYRVLQSLVPSVVIGVGAIHVDAEPGARADPAKVLNLAFAEFAPYQYEYNGVPQGYAIDMLNEIAPNLSGLELRFHMVPNYARAVKETKDGTADGFFLASRNAERDSIAVFSEPLTNNNWNWFFTDRSVDSTTEHFKASAKVGTVLHTNTHRWLMAKGYQRIMPVMRPALLPKLLELGRIDAVFLAEAVFEEECAKNNIDKALFKHKVEVAKPFGIYIGRQYLAEHPSFMQDLNEAIKEYNRELD